MKSELTKSLPKQTTLAKKLLHMLPLKNKI